MAQPPKAKQNPIQTAVSSWLDSLPPALLDALSDQLTTHTTPDDAKQLLLDRAPKRWVIYEPMVLLPSGSFTSPAWRALLPSLAPADRETLWTAILNQLSPRSKPPLTHLAINEGIPLHLPPSPPARAEPDSNGNEPPGSQEEREETENLLRSPTHLHPLHGDFGPAPTGTSTPPTTTELNTALWVTTKQNGLHQTWAPRHTMFSRGNVKEKGRLLQSFPLESAPQSQSRNDPAAANKKTKTTTKVTARPASKPPVQAAAAAAAAVGPPTRPETDKAEKWAVDLYAGIGYFAFSYAALGMRVLCWEVNPWSVEGLRRGAEQNGFGVAVVVVGDDDPTTATATATAAVTNDDTTPAAAAAVAGEVDLGGLVGPGGPQIVVFLEDNRHAAGRIRRLREQRGGGGGALEAVHVNCGFLPTSQPVWRDAWEMVLGEGWLHLHENVGVEDIETRRQEVQGLMDRWRVEKGEEDDGKVGTVDHVERVKTFAPGVWHCVFDVRITRSATGGVE